jgi:hypothetical protein
VLQSSESMGPKCVLAKDGESNEYTKLRVSNKREADG